MEIDATGLRHEEPTVSVVSCLPISRGRLSVVPWPWPCPHAAVVSHCICYIVRAFQDVTQAGSFLVDIDDPRSARISPGRGAESSSGWALGLDVLAARVTRGDRSGCDGDERIIVCSEDPGRQRSVLMNGRGGTSVDGGGLFWACGLVGVWAMGCCLSVSGRAACLARERNQGTSARIRIP